MVFQPGMIKLAAKKYPGETLRLILFYMGVTERDNRIKNYTQQEISETINIARANVSKANRVLMQDGVIFKNGRDYYFSDEYLIKDVQKYMLHAT